MVSAYFGIGNASGQMSEFTKFMIPMYVRNKGCVFFFQG
jgi:hypothetical protein